MDSQAKIPVAYCERGAFTKDVRKLWRGCRRIHLIHFPYDRDDREWHRNHHVPFARPSLVTSDTTQIYASDRFLISDMAGSEKYNEIAKILGQANKHHDVRHFDSAYKSGAHMFITADRNYYNHSQALYVLTSIHVFYVFSGSFLEDVRYFISHVK